MPKIEASSQQIYNVAAETVILLQVAVQHDPAQKIISESLELSGAATSDALQEYELSGEGNRLHRFVCPPGEITIDYHVVAETDVELVEDPQPSPTLATLPPEVLRYTYPSRYCESDRLANFAAQQFGSMHPDDSRVTAIANWVYEHMTYDIAATGPHDSASTVFDGGRGVCRDYAHLMIALCRALDIPARYVSGYVADLEPPDFHALVEAYVGDGWFLFDPTRLAPRTGLIRITRGVDAAETAFCTIIGSAQLQSQSVKAWLPDGKPVQEAARVKVG